jgi:FlaA1/EpsC-like NDP-sugar epimerase
VPESFDLLDREPIFFGGNPAFFCGQDVLVTGAAGTIGSALVRALRTAGVSVCGVDRRSADEVDSQGDLCDAAFLRAVLAGHSVIFHAAALKHVDRAELDPDLAWRINRDLVRDICDARQLGSRLLFVSTDKAAFPLGVMGQSKREAEGIVQSNGEQGPALVVRFPNILGSSDSVLPIWANQMSSDQPLTLTDPEATRWFLTESEAIDLLLAVCARGESGGIHVPQLGGSVSMADLRHRFLASHQRPDHPVKITGLRSGEKKHEVLFEHPPGRPSKISGVGLDQVDSEA